MSKEQKTIEVKIASLEAFLSPVKSVKIRAESLISDHYRGSYLLDSQSLLLFMEICISAKVAISRIEELQTDAKDASVSSLFLPPEEILLLSTLFKSVAASGEISPLSGISLVKN